MKNRWNIVLLSILTAVSATMAGSELITTFKDNSIECDYLIVTVQEFSKPAVALAQHRNSFKYDGVDHAKVIFLPQILAEFPGFDFTQRNIALWNGLKWAKANWKVPFKYVVFIGNESYSINSADSTISSDGVIPTWYLNNNVNDVYLNPPMVTDDFYSAFSTVEPPSAQNYVLGDSNLSIGRIPAATAVQCSIFVEKVKRFDLSRPGGTWRNNVLAIADDAMQGTYLDVLQNWLQLSAERIFWNSLQGYSVTKSYLSAYPLDQFYEKPTAKEATIKKLNDGVSWAFFFGHGNSNVLTDEHVLTSESIDRISNDSMPFVFVSFTAGNGSFWASTPASMCLKYLFSPKGGAIAYIASPSSTGAISNDVLGQSFFAEVKKAPAGSLGSFLTRAKIKSNGDQNNATYFLLGDPALRISTGLLPVTTKFAADGDTSHFLISIPGYSGVNYSISFTVRDSVQAAPVSIDVPDLSFSRDSVVGAVSGVFRDSVTIALPHGLTGPVKAIVYVWNDTADGRAEQLLNQGPLNPVLRKSLRKSDVNGLTLRKIRSTLTLSGLESGVSQVRIYDVRGRSIYNGEIRAVAGGATIELAGKVQGAGQYFLQVRGRGPVKTLPFVYLAGGE